MKTKNRFEETKIKLVMKLKKLTHQEAVAEIARMAAAKDMAKAIEDEMGEGVKRRQGTPNVGRTLLDAEGMSAKDFFGED